MKTDVLPVSAASIDRAALLLKAGEVVAFPTETVYGLGANALDEGAVAKIFAAKGRPADNPLIAHIADRAALPLLVRGVDRRARALMDAFWPGPLTLIFEKTDRVPAIVSAGLSTVAVRMPSHEAARALIERSGVPVAAPSANRSGRPSPTTAAHVLSDMDGRIPLILDGGPCAVGVESTVVDLSGGAPTILRPGGVTAEMLRGVLQDVLVDPAVLSPLRVGETARSPGMKHRHYAPSARVVVVRGVKESVAEETRRRYDEAEEAGKRALILCQSAMAGAYGQRRVRVLGTGGGEMASHLFDALREADRLQVELVIAEGSGTEGMGLALMNRLLRAADFDVVDV